MVDEAHRTNISIFIKIYRSFLQDGGSLRIDQITHPYIAMNTGMHLNAGSKEIDFAAFLYVSLRLPGVMDKVKTVVLSQTDEIFKREGYDLQGWEYVSAPARRRKMLFDGKEQLGVFINSVTDVDDIICLLTAFQIEWNKIYAKLIDLSPEVKHSPEKLKHYLGMDDEIWDKFKKIWKDSFIDQWAKISEGPLNLQIKLLRGSYVDYKKAVQKWFENIYLNSELKNNKDARVYFVSSNTHSIVNNITGFVNSVEKDLIKYLKKNNMDDFLQYWEDINEGSHPGSKENFLWYILKKYEVDHSEVSKKRREYEKELGVEYFEAKHFLDINAQVIKLSSLAEKEFADKIGIKTKQLKDSNAFIFNIDYPLGFGAYMVLSTILQNINNVKGVYILGKASFLNGNLGDIGIPTVAYDEFSGNTYFFNNAFNSSYFKEFKAGNVLSNQKVSSIRGTLLQPEILVKEFFKKGFSLLEMENGSYLNALYEVSSYDRYPEMQSVDLLNSPIDIGIINYASDTPFTKAITLATRNLGYEGVEATYVSSLAILKRIVECELKSVV